MLDTDKSFNLVFRSIGFEQPVLFGAVFKQRALPATLFFDAKGRLVSTKIGEFRP